MNEIAVAGSGEAFALPMSVAPPGLTWREKLAYLTVEFLKRPQVELPLEHNIIDDTYYRTISIPRDTLLIGRMHLRGHLCKLLRGDLILIHEDGILPRATGDQLHSTPGYMMCLGTLSDCIGQTVHPAEGETDYTVLEPRWFETKEHLLQLGHEVHARIAQQGLLS